MHYMGIDVSKAKLDFALLDGRGKVVAQAEVKNTTAGVTSLHNRWQREFGLTPTASLACFEPTGHYSDNVLATLLALKVPTWMAHPLDIKRSMGFVRDKNDRIDAVRIADYAMRHQDKKHEAGPTTLAVIELKQLSAFRDRLVVDARRHSVYNSDLHPRVAKPYRKFFSDYSSESSRRIKDMIKKVDRTIKEHIMKDPVMREQYKLLLSIERVGPVLAAHLMAATELFTRMTNARQLACHCGIAPHKHTSGSSIHGRARVSHHADKRLKSLLHMAAIGLLQKDGDLRRYYDRKIAEGKNPMSVLNALRNKLVHRICAVVKRGTSYEFREVTTTETQQPSEKPAAVPNFTASGKTETGNAGEQPARDKPDERRATAMGGETKGLPAQAWSSSCLKKLNKPLADVIE